MRGLNADGGFAEPVAIAVRAMAKVPSLVGSVEGDDRVGHGAAVGFALPS